jgi:hypothetical protein
MLTRRLIVILHILRNRAAAPGARARDERGDVPGWVLITLMTAALVLVLWGLASESFSGIWERAMGLVDPIGR